LKSFSSPFSSEEKEDSHGANRSLLSEDDDNDGEEGMWDNGAIQMEVKKRPQPSGHRDNNSLDL
jgi:hypothetical protein